MKRKTAIFLLLLNAIISAAGYIWINTALDAGLSATAIVTLRGYIACIGCFVLFGKQAFQTTRTEFFKCLILGAVNFLGFILSAESSALSTPSNVSLILSSCMVVVPFINWLVNRERPSIKVCLCALLCLFGIAVLTGSLKNGFSPDLGVLLAFASTLAFSFHTVLSSNYSKNVNYRALVFYSALCMAIGGTVLYTFEPGAFCFSGIDLIPAALSTLGLGLLASLAYFIIQMYTFAYVPVTTGILLLSTDAMFTSILSVIVGYDVLTAELITGGILITVSVLLQELDLSVILKKEKKDPS